MEIVDSIAPIISAVGGLIVAIAAAGLIRKLESFIDRIQM